MRNYNAYFQPDEKIVSEIAAKPIPKPVPQPVPKPAQKKPKKQKHLDAKLISSPKKEAPVPFPTIYYPKKSTPVWVNNDRKIVAEKDYDENYEEDYNKNDYDEDDYDESDYDEDDFGDDEEYDYYDDDYEQLVEEDEEFEMETINEHKKKHKNLADWEKYEHVLPGQECAAPFRFFSKSSHRPVIAISSFPGSGNTWARHLLHMASGYWTGNKRSAKPLKAAGWKGEDVDCKDGTTVAQKTHRLHHNNGIFIIRFLDVSNN